MSDKMPDDLLEAIREVAGYIDVRGTDTDEDWRRALDPDVWSAIKVWIVTHPAEVAAMSTKEDRDNNIMAAGAVLAWLWTSQYPTDAQPVIDADGSATNQIDIQLAFMNSTYRVTVERVPGTEQMP